jgi:hypothetical protein
MSCLLALERAGVPLPALLLRSDEVLEPALVILELLLRRRHDILRPSNDFRREFVRVNISANVRQRCSPLGPEFPYLR